MTESLRQLLDDRIPPIPDRLRHPPVQELVRRGRRQRRRARLAAAAAGVVVAAGTALVVQLASTETAVPPTPPATRTSEQIGVPWRWVMARLDRTERQLTVYLAAVEGCRDVHLVDASASESPTEVIVDVQAWSLPANECETAGTSVTETIELSAPLGDRALRDGYDDRRPRLYRDRELPMLAEHGWEEINGTFALADGNFWAVSYQRPNQPEIWIRVQPTALVRRPDTSATGTTALGGHEGTIYPRPGTHSYEVRWTVDDLTYVLTALPNEGDAVSLGQFRSLIGALVWA